MSEKVVTKVIKKWLFKYHLSFFNVILGSNFT